MTLLAAVGGGALAGAVGASGASPVAILVILLAPAVLVAMVLQPSTGLLVMAFIVYTHLSDVAVSHGAPSVFQPFILVLLAALVARARRDRALPAGLTTPAALLTVYGIVLSLGLFHVRDFDASFTAFTGYVRDAVVALLAFALLRSGRMLQQLIWVLVLSGGMLAVLGVVQYLTGSFGNDFGGFAQASVKNIAGNKDDFRISGPIADPNHWAQALLVVIPLALGRMRRSAAWGSRLLAGGVFATCVLALVFTYSRGALVALAALGVIALCLRPPRLWACALLTVGLVVSLPALPPAYVDRVGQLTQALPGMGDGRTSESSLSSRLSAVLAGQAMVLDHPLVGVGAGQFTVRYREYSLGLGVNNAQGGVEPHNMYLEVAAETGYLGLLSWGAIVGVAFWRLRCGRLLLRQAGKRRESDLVEDLALALAGYLLSGMFVHNAYPRLFWLLIGAALAVPVVVRSVMSGNHDAEGEGLPLQEVEPVARGAATATRPLAADRP